MKRKNSKLEPGGLPSQSGEQLPAEECVPDRQYISELETEIKKYQDIFHAITDMVFEADVTGHVQYISPNVRDILGYEPEEVIGEVPTKFIVSEGSLEKFEDALKAGAQGIKVESLEVLFLHKDGRILSLEINAVPFFSDEGAILGFRGVSRDITEQKMLEKELQNAKDELEGIERERTELAETIKILVQSEEKYRKLVEDAQSIILRMDLKGNITFINDFAEKFFGYSEEEILGRNVIGTIVPEKESTGRDLEDLINNIAQNPAEFTNNENETMRKNGERIWIAWTNAPVLNERGKLKEVLCVGNDISHQKKIEAQLKSAQKKLRAMTAEIVYAEARSRQQFATELHDTVVQTLGAAKFRSELIQEKIPLEARGLFSELQDMLSQSMTQARLIMSEMSPPVLNELGLFSALEWLAEQIKTHYGIDVSFISNRKKQKLPIAHEIEVFLFQATRELLMNVVKHAQAGIARVKVSSDDQKLRIEVSDDGKGFDVKSTFQPDFKGGYGLYSIRERLRHIGGQMAIKSNPGHGTTVLMLAPRELEK